jgi:hypothetical protein
MVDHVLDRLIVAAERWVPRHGGLSTQDDWNPTVSEEESDPPTVLEPKNKPVDDTSGSLNPLQSLVTETLVSAPTPPSVSPPSTAKDPTQPGPTPAASKKEEIEHAPATLPKKEKEPRPRVVIPKMEKMEPALVRLSREEGPKPIAFSSCGGYIRIMPVVPPEQEEKPKLASVTSKDEVV